MKSLSKLIRGKFKHLILIIFCLWHLYDFLIITLSFNCDVKSTNNIPSRQDGLRVYIAGQFWNGADLIKTRWSPQIIDLVRYFGQDNVYISIYGSASFDGAEEALKALKNDLLDRRIQHTIIQDPETHAEAVERESRGQGWLTLSNGERVLRRIPYLANIRNKVMEPLKTLEKQGILFDVVLFAGDVEFTTKDVVNLLETRNGDFATVCALDFSRIGMIYDTFALRDAEGQELLTQEWPYFRSRTSRKALLYNKPIPVQSCWNGLVVMKATPFYEDQPLLFRGLSDSLADSHLEASECCLIHVDNSFARKKGIWVNPKVEVSYPELSYDQMKTYSCTRSTWSRYVALWRNRVNLLLKNGNQSTNLI